jgi:hypothetical protein
MTRPILAGLLRTRPKKQTRAASVRPSDSKTLIPLVRLLARQAARDQLEGSTDTPAEINHEEAEHLT